MNIKMNFLKIKREKKFKKKNFSFNVNFYWKVLLFLTLFLIIFAFGFSFYVFHEINKESVFPNIKTSGQMEKVKKERIESILNYFIEKEQNIKDILDLNSPVVDPS